MPKNPYARSGKVHVWLHERDDWLSNYQHEWGIKRALNGIGRRIGYSKTVYLRKKF